MKKRAARILSVSKLTADYYNKNFVINNLFPGPPKKEARKLEEKRVNK